MPVKLNTEIFIRRSIDKHGDKYDYSLSNYVNTFTKVDIICPIHGKFEQKPHDHMNGRGCMSCGKAVWVSDSNLKKRFDLFLTNANKIHGDKYTYIFESYKSTNKKCEIICPIHGKFTQILSNHLRGNGCPKCSKILYKNKRAYDDDKFIEKAILKHGNFYDYSMVDYKDSHSKVDIICPIHGIFQQKANAHLIGAGCYECGKIKKSNNKIKNYDWYEKCLNAHGNRYDYSLVGYSKNTIPVKIICEKHGIFEQTLHSHIKGSGCPSCGVTNSNMENFVEDILKNNNINYIKNDRTIITNAELDFYIPEFNLAFECNGNYWHSEVSGGKNKNYHVRKTDECLAKNIKLVHIFEDEYIQNKNIIKSKIKNLLKLNKYKIYARKCAVAEISTDIKNTFLRKYHIQGSDKSKYKYGLFYRNRLVAVMTFCSLRTCMGSKSDIGVFELSRYATISNFNIIGGASKILAYFRRIMSNPKIISYADRRFSTGGLYEKIGFNRVATTPPNYWYLIRNGNYLVRKHRFNYAKHTLSKKLKKFDAMESEWVNMKNNGYDRIWDCGSIKYELI